MSNSKPVILYDGNDYQELVANDSTLLRKFGTAEEEAEKIEEIDDDINNNIRALLRGEIDDGHEMDIRVAISIMLQGRNLTATAVGLPRRDPHFAVYSRSVPLADASANFLNSMFGEFAGCKIKTYNTPKDLFAQILKGAVVAVVNVDDDSDVEGTIRHEVKNIPDWSFDEAQTTPLPPCFNTNPFNLFPVVLELSSVWISVKNGGEFNFLPMKYEQPEVVKQEPMSTVRILIVDDEEDNIDNMSALFKDWPNVRIETWFVDRETRAVPISREADNEFNVVLLDHDMGKLKPGRAIEFLNGRPIIVSTTLQPETPSYATRGNHFQLKRVCGDDPSPAIQWFNSFFIREGFML